ncbi:GA module-containing protein [Mycoplasma buteonis]|uniref:GA module-containing protein n=1 Tax=Mycoplasma buteonis TaxID=171280 RepID=UPI00056CD153|nr:GA module-containing protein [Mycoplasma buteonis]
MKKKILLSFPLAVLSTTSIIALSTSIDNSQNQGTPSVEQQKQYIQSLAFDYGKGGLNSYAIKYLNDKIDKHDNWEEVKALADKWNALLTKWYGAFWSFTFGDPNWRIYFKAHSIPGYRNNDITYSEGKWGKLSTDYNNKDRLVNLMQHYLSFFYSDEKATNNNIGEDWTDNNFKQKYDQLIKDFNPSTNKNTFTEWRGGKSYNSTLVQPLRKLNTHLDTISTEVDATYNTHVGPLAQLALYIIGLQGNVNGADLVQSVGSENIQKINKAVPMYKDALKLLLEKTKSLKEEEYKKSDFYLNLKTEENKNKLKSPISYFTNVINITKNPNATLSTLETVNGLGKFTNFIDVLFGTPTSTVSKPLGYKITEAKTSVQELIKVADKNLQDAKNDFINTFLESKKDLLSNDLYNNIKNTVNGKTNITLVSEYQTTVNETIEKLKTFAEKVKTWNGKKSEDKYTKATTETKQAFDNSFTNDFLDDNNKFKSLDYTDEKGQQVLTNIETAWNNLTEDLTLKNKKDEVLSSIDQMENLNNAQKTALKQKVQEADSVEAVSKIKTQATTLNNSMGMLKEKFEELKKKKTETKYVDASNKEEFDSKITEAENLLNIETGSNSNNESVTQLISELSQKWDALDGEAQLQKAKDEALKKLEPHDSEEAEFKYLTDVQKENLKKAINSAASKADLAQIMKIAAELNEQMKLLTDVRTDTKNIIQTSNYKDAEEEKQNDYKAAVTSALEANKASSNPSLQEVKEILKTYNEAKAALNGDSKLAQAKKEAQAAIEELTNLNEAQKSDLKAKINSSTSIADVEAQKTNANTLDQKMNDLKAAINDAKSYKTNQDYLDSTQETKSAFDSTITDADAKVSNQNITTQEIENLILELNNKKNDLNGIEELVKAKEQASNAVDAFENLTENQKNKLKQLINDKTNKTEVAQALEKATKLNEAMQTLKDAKNKAEQEKNTPNYTQASQDTQNDLVSAIETAQEFLNNIDSQDVSVETILSHASALDEARENLDGNKRLADAKTKAIDEINSLPNLNDSQKKDLRDKVEQSQTLNQVEEVKTSGNQLNDSMGELLKEINKVKPVKENSQPKYSQASNKADFDKVLANAESTKNKLTGHNLDKASVDALIKDLKAKYDALDGDSQVLAEKNKAKAEINNLTHLNDAQKRELISQIEAEEVDTIQKVQTKLEEAKKLDEAMNLLKMSIKKIDDTNYLTKDTETYQNWIDASNSIKENFDTKKNQADTLVNQTLGESQLNLETIKNLASSLTEAYDALDGKKELEKAKTFAKESIANRLEHLNNAQKEALAKNIDSQKFKNDVADLWTSASKLNDTMGGLKVLKNKLEDTNKVLESSKYLNADDQLKNTFKTTLDKVNSLLNAQTGENQNQAQVNNLQTELQEAYNALNGDTKLAKSKERALNDLENLTHLNNAQKEAAKTAINNAKLDEQVASQLEKATDLNEKMNQLSTLVDTANQTKSTPKYTEASNKQNFDLALADAKEILNIETGGNLDSNKVDEEITKLQKTLAALDGEAQLEAAKELANSDLAKLTHLTQAQKDTILEQIQAATTKSDLEALVNNAKKLDKAMEKLEETKTDLESTKETENYKDATINPNQSQFDNVLEQVVSALTPEGNLSLEQANQLLKNSKEKEQALDGDARFNDLKGLLEAELQNQDDYRESKLFGSASQDLKDFYNQAIATATEVKENTGFERGNITYAQLDNLYNEILKAKSKMTADVQDAENLINKLPNLSQSEKRNLINQLHINTDQKDKIVQTAVNDNDKKQTEIDKIQNLSYLSREDKTKFINEIKQTNAHSDQEIQDIVDKSIAANDLAKIVNDTLNELSNNFDETKVSDLRNKIDKLNKLTNNTLNQTNLLNKLINTNNIQQAIREFDSANISNTNIDKLLENLNNAVTPKVETSVSFLQAATLKANDENKATRQLADATAYLFKALQTNDTNLLKLANEKLNELNITNNNKFISDLNPVNEELLNIFKKQGSDISPSDIEKLEAVETNGLSIVMKSLYEYKLQELKDRYNNANLSETMQWPWWAGLGATILGLVANLIALIKRKK